MNNLKAFSLAGLLLGSMSAQAGVITFPDSVSFDINADPWTFSIPFTGDPRDGFRVDVPSVYYTLENDDYYAQFDDAGYNDGTIDFGLRILFAAPRPSSEAAAVGKETIIGPLLDQVYTYTVRFNFRELLPCEDGEWFCGYGPSSGLVNESVQVSFFDSAAQEVPVGPTGALLLVGLAGMLVHRKLSYSAHLC
ncbi:MAG: hypothetical protein CME36_09295 [unclassified Hahellaceae]|nr:hypothetical protein [Hahellaceae bacterium]|tara:strand:- start:56504 stop:57082 length:579 start_codon:yes stop_codon:yes gene_type:complete